MNKYGAPEHAVEAIERFVQNRFQPGGFITAILANDLREACCQADYINKHKIFEIVSYCWNEIPHTCWGSYEKVHTWLKGEEL